MNFYCLRLIAIDKVQNVSLHNSSTPHSLKCKGKHQSNDADADADDYADADVDADDDDDDDSNIPMIGSWLWFDIC